MRPKPLALLTTLIIASCPALVQPCRAGELDELGSASRSQLLELTEAIRKDPKNAKPYLRRGDFYSKANMDDEALADYAKALTIDKNDPEAYYCRGNFYYHAEEFAKGAADFLKAAELGAPRTKGMACRNAGRCFIELHKYNDAINALTKGLPVEITPSLSLLERARCYVALKKYKEAIADINAMSPNKPLHNDLALAVRADAEIALNQPQAAVDDLTIAIKTSKKRKANFERMVFSTDGEKLYRMRSKAYEKLGQKDLATADLKSAMRLQKESLEFAPFR